MIIPTIGPIDAAEAKPVYFLLAGEVGAATISTATITATLMEGTDANPQGILSGSVTIDNAQKIVSQKVAAPGRIGCRYKLRCVATDSAGYSHTVAAELAVVAL